MFFTALVVWTRNGLLYHESYNSVSATRISSAMLFNNVCWIETNPTLNTDEEFVGYRPWGSSLWCQYPQKYPHILTCVQMYISAEERICHRLTKNGVDLQQFWLWNQPQSHQQQIQQLPPHARNYTPAFPSFIKFLQIIKHKAYYNSKIFIM